MAGMYFKYGDYPHPVGEVLVSNFDVSSEQNENGTVLSKTVTMQLDGIIVAAGDVAIDARVAEIQNAYALDGYSAALIRTDGAPSHLALDSGSSLYGVQVVSGPNFPLQRNAAHYATGLPFTITLKAKYGVSGNRLFLGLSESIEQIGDGGPIVVITTLDNGRPVADQVSPASPVIVTQSGESTYELSSALAAIYPPFNPPLFPNNLIRPDGYRRNRAKARPRIAGRNQYKATWNYTFQFTEPPFIPNPGA